MKKVELQDGDYTWLLNSMEKLKRKTYTEASAWELEVAQTVHRIVDALEGAVDVSAQPEINTADPPTPKPRAKRKPKAANEEVIPRQHSCAAHPTYTGQRRPRKDCETCWEVYKYFNPASYELQRRKFERLQRAAR